MALEQTLSIIKPDAVAKGYVDEICKRLEESGLSLIKKKAYISIKKKQRAFT